VVVAGAVGCDGIGAGAVLLTTGTVVGVEAVEPVVPAVAGAAPGISMGGATGGVDSTTGALLEVVSDETVLGAFSWQETKDCTARAAKIKFLNAFFIIIRF
jgi:hypothetical protein